VFSTWKSPKSVAIEFATLNTSIGTQIQYSEINPHSMQKHNCICVCQYPFRLIAPQTSIQPTFSNIKSISHRIVLQSPFTHSRTAIGLIPIQSVDRRIGLNCHNYTHSDIFCSWYLGIISILLFCYFFFRIIYIFRIAVGQFF